MAKKGKSTRGGAKKAKTAAPVAVEGLDAFQRGRYPLARSELKAVAADNDRPEGERMMAQDLFDATGIEKGALWTALACIGLFAIVIAITVIKQP